MRIRQPFFLRRRIERIVHDAVIGRPDGFQPVIRRTVEFDCRAERTARHLQRADKRRQKRPRPAGLISAPAVIDALAKHNGDRPERHFDALDLDRLADTGMGDIFIRDLPDLVGGYVAFSLGPVWVELRHVIEQKLERRPGNDAVMFPYLAVGAVFNAGNGIGPFKRGIADFFVPRLYGAVGQIADQRFARHGIAHVVAVRPDKVGRCRVFLQRPHVAGFVPVALDQHPVDEREQKRRIGLRFDRNPFRRQRARDREMRFDLDTFQPADTRIRLAPHARDAARRFDVIAAIDDVVAVRRVRRNDERPVPQFPVKMFRVIALHPLSAAKAHIERSPCRQEGGECSHILGRGAAAAEGYGQPRKTAFVLCPAGAHVAHPPGNGIQRFFPRYRDETRVLVAAFFRVGALHRRPNPVRVVGLLDQAIGFDADSPAAGVPVGDVVI